MGALHACLAAGAVKPGRWAHVACYDHPHSPSPTPSKVPYTKPCQPPPCCSCTHRVCKVDPGLLLKQLGDACAVATLCCKVQSCTALCVDRVNLQACFNEAPKAVALAALGRQVQRILPDVRGGGGLGEQDVAGARSSRHSKVTTLK